MIVLKDEPTSSSLIACLKAKYLPDVFRLESKSAKLSTLSGVVHTMNLLWKSERSKSCQKSQLTQHRRRKLKLTLTNSLPLLFSVPRAWFLNTTSSSHRRFMLKSCELSRGFPRAMSTSRCSCSWAATSCSYMKSACNHQKQVIFPDMTHLLFFLCQPFFLDLLQLAHQLGCLVLIVTLLLAAFLF